MAKGDKTKVQNQIDTQGGLAQNWLNNTRNNIIPQNQDLQNRAQVSYDQAGRDYSNIQQGWQNYLGDVKNFDASRNSFGAYPMYQNFAQTGGYSPEDIAAMRARGEGAVRSVFDSTRRNLEQQNRIQGGSSTARTAALAKATRDTEQGVSDADINLEAQLADAIRQGKLAGMAGMTGIDTSALQGGLAKLGAQASGVGGMNTAYGTTPGQANMYGNLLGRSNEQMINMQQLQQSLADMLMHGQINATQVPGNFQQAMGNIGSVLNLGSKFFGLPNLFGGGGSGMYSSPSQSYQPSDQYGYG